MDLERARAEKDAGGSGVRARVLLLLVVACAFGAGFLVTGPEASARAVADAGDDLVRLLRAMAGLKAVMAAGLTAGVVWRLGSGAGWAWTGAYAVGCAAMWAGPGVIWGMAHVGAGALLLHGGLVVTAVLLWRDPVVGSRLAAAIAARRAALRA